jgi:membrane fusion protein (multidrug efflux system)
VRAVVEERPDAILVPQQAIQEIQGAKSVLVVGTDDKVALRSVTLNERIGDLTIVSRGLEPGERVIVEGLQKVRPGMQVKPEAAPLPASAPAAGAPPSTSTPPAPGAVAPTAPAPPKPKPATGS